MDTPTARRALGTSLLVVLAVITFQEVKVSSRAPAPSRYVGAAVAYFILAVAAEGIPQVAGPLGILVAFGMLLSTGGVINVPGLTPSSSSSSSSPSASSSTTTRPAQRAPTPGGTR
jgi:hypothetical protein